MDFLAQLDERLLETPKLRSRLAPYIEAHLLFQRDYHTPSPTPTPPSSPGLETSIIAASKQALSPTFSPYSRPLKRKRVSVDKGDRTVALPKQARMSNAHKCSIQPCTPTAIAMPSPSTCPASPHPSQRGALIEEYNTDACSTSIASAAKKHALEQWPIVIVGKYTLRRTAARAQREGLLHGHSEKDCCTGTARRTTARAQREGLLHGYSEKNYCTGTARRTAAQAQRKELLYRHSEKNYYTGTARRTTARAQQEGLLYRHSEKDYCTGTARRTAIQA
ncbi:hypothetical protein P153DRAFT_371545 [Dothidotthia symphoricarpi CBS 119687]|uniref:Uncharacterized protein n=1 Tax=Dothidotthia symphoricarpi CBS 119687 TaxID=1392245 RepID=A0A6A5ZZB8_9PLEO|nr:uncharacterized protein P153DRAFT_371545 [Dothidotthia symphoricarpi CBS 119687]KAF2123661.1 hypothetical protein P153DRAFT_371545 [Dothidotthia symphoricarpi CBS 119687]